MPGLSKRSGLGALIARLYIWKKSNRSPPRDKDELFRRADKPAPPVGASAYKPSAVRREGRKLDTQKQYAAWQKSYKELKRNRRGMSDVWYSQQIAKQDIANNRDAETIRKHMKR
jgi:hypothetical protein